MNHTRIAWCLLVVAPAATPLSGQDSTVMVAPGTHYDTGWLHRVFFGEHYRELWATPIEAEVLDLDRFAGGLTATGKGGGQQTKSLRFRGADGREYQFRSLDKDPTPALPPPLRQSAARDIVQDQISAAHPAGALVVPPILEAVGVLHPTPRVVVLPEQHPRLGEFAGEFGGMLGTIEERPSNGAGAGFAGATEVISSDRLLKVTEDSPTDRVAARELLAARLADLFLGDWDRHFDQWRWARFGDSVPRVWHPIPRDRDQAFVRFDGVLLSIARGSAPQWVNFGPDYPGILGLTWNGREVDRRFLTGLERPAWDSIAAAIQARLTDSVIEAAAARLPAPYVPLDSARLADALKQRRDALPEAAGRFYRHLAGEVEVHGTDLDDVAVADRVDDRYTVVTVALRGPDGSAGEPYFQRRFDREETKEVRLHLHAGEDRAVVRGPGRGGVRVRVLPGAGRDAVADSAAGGAVHLYTTEPEDSVLPGSDVAVSRRPYEPTHPAVRDWGTRWLPLMWASGGPDVGLFLGAGVTHTRYGFRQDPYASRYLLRAGYATGAATGRAELLADWRRPNSRVRYGLYARASGIEVLRFHGFGNERPAEEEDEFYRVNEVNLTLAPAVWLPLGARMNLRLGPVLSYTDTDFDEPRFITLDRPYGSGKFGSLGAVGAVEFDARNRPRAATHGVLLRVGASYYPSLLDVTDDFGDLGAMGAAYFTADSLPLQPTLALRAGAQRVWGRFPYQHSAFIGDVSTVRLGRQNRYAGESSLYGGAELRLRLSAFNVLVPGELGVFGLGDVGRVYVDGESSKKWHGAVGGGIWLSFLERVNTLSVSVVSSAERTRVYVGAGFGIE